MKQLKYILSFVILILQFNIANSFASASIFDNEGFCVNEIDISEKGIQNLDFSEPDFKENHILEPSFHEIASCTSIYFCGVYAELVDSWKRASDIFLNGSKLVTDIPTSNTAEGSAFRNEELKILDDPLESGLSQNYKFNIK